jgi:hypothetical protein
MQGPYKGCDTAQAVNCWIPTAAAQVQDQTRSCGICGGQTNTTTDFLQVLPSTATATATAGTIGQE